MNLPATLSALSWEQIGGVAAGLTAVAAACASAWRQKQKPDATDAEKSGFGNTVRLVREDRQRIDDLGERVGDLTRAIKGHCEAVEDHTAAVRRKPGR